MAERKPPAKRTRRPTAAELSAGRANLAAGRAAKAKQRAEAKEKGLPKAKERWAMLLDGRLSVSDLDDQEISRMAVRNAAGGFGGKRRLIPSHLAQQFHQESIKRSHAKLLSAAPEAVQALLDIGNDSSVKEGDRVRALIYVVDRALGKTPETVQFKGESPWDNLLGEGASIQDLRDLADLADGSGGPQDLT